MTEPGRAESAAALAKCPRLAAGEPFDFVCAGCGDCCRNRRDLVLSGYDLYRIARRLGLPVADVEQAIATTYAMLKALDLETYVPGGGALLSGAY